MINYINSHPDLLRDPIGPIDPSVPEPPNDILSDAEPWALLALRAQWLGRVLQQLADAERSDARAVEVAYADNLRRQLARSGAVLELLQCLDRLGAEVDHKRWARRIIARIAAGDASVTPYQARAALDALCAPG